MEALEASITSTPSGPAFAALLLSRAELHRLQSEWQKSLDDLDEASKFDPDLKNLDLQRGLTLLLAGRTHEAVVAFEDHLTAHPDDGLVWTQLGRALADLRVYPDASRAFARAIELSRNPSPELFLDRADAIQAQGPARYSDALALIESGISIIGPAISLELRALSLEQLLGRYDLALERVSILTNKSRSKAPWLLRKGELLRLAARPKEARHVLEEAKALALNAPVARRTPSNRDLLKSIEDLLAASQE